MNELWQQCRACGLLKELCWFAYSWCNRLGRATMCKQCFNKKYGRPDMAVVADARFMLKQVKNAIKGINPRNAKRRKPRALPLESFCGIDLSDVFPSNRPAYKEAITAFMRGISLRSVARQSGLSAVSIRKIYRKMKAAGMLQYVKCACGQQASHQGWCTYRFQRSERRQAYLAKMHERQRSTKL